MAKNRRHRRGTATLLSRSTAIVIAAFGAAARAQDTAPPPVAPPAGAEVAQPAPAYPPPPAVYTSDAPLPPPVYTPPSPATSPPPGPSGFERRQHLGAQIGGTGIIQIVYRLRALGPLHLEVGALGANHGGNFSAGVLFGAPVANRWFPYVALGGGLMIGGAPSPTGGCDAASRTCPEKVGDAMQFVHARAGVGFAFGATRRHLLALDVGGWWGTHYEDWNDTAGQRTRSSKALAMPMAGLSYFFAIH